jgi:hypothetical protein
MIYLVNQLFGYATVDSQFFSVRVRSKLPRKESFILDAVIGQRYPPTIQANLTAPTGGSLRTPPGRPVILPLEILSWREGISS